MDDANAQTVSLLYPYGFEAYAAQVAELRHDRAATDLGLDALAGALSIDSHYTDGIKTILATLCDEPQVIRYRHAVLDDFLNCPAVAAGLQASLPMLVQLGYIGGGQRSQQSQLQQAVARLGELELYVD